MVNGLAVTAARHHGRPAHQTGSRWTVSRSAARRRNTTTSSSSRRASSPPWKTPRAGPSISDFITGLSIRVFPAGRLDYDADGLMLLTNDGRIANLAMHPRLKGPQDLSGQGRRRPLRARAGAVCRRHNHRGQKDPPGTRSTPSRSGRVTPGTRSRFPRGGTARSRRCSACSASGSLKIRRIAIGPLSLEGLAPGELRKLTARECELLFCGARHEGGTVRLERFGGFPSGEITDRVRRASEAASRGRAFGSPDLSTRRHLLLYRHGPEGRPVYPRGRRRGRAGVLFVIKDVRRAAAESKFPRHPAAPKTARPPRMRSPARGWQTWRLSASRWTCCRSRTISFCRSSFPARRFRDASGLIRKTPGGQIAPRETS